MVPQLMAVLAAILMLGGLSLADGAPATSAPATQALTQAEKRMAQAIEQGQQMAAKYIQWADPVVSLSDEQKKEITDAALEFSKAWAEFEAKNAAKIQAINKAIDKARAANDEETLISVQQEQQQLYEPWKRVSEKYRQRKDKLLTAQQKAKLEDWQLTKALKELVAPNELTDQQIKAIKAAANGLDWNAKWYAMQAAADTILTPQQRAKIRKRDAMQQLPWNLPGIKLSPEQVKEAEALCDKILKNSDLDESELMNQLLTKVESLLTPEQKEARKQANGGE